MEKFTHKLIISCALLTAIAGSSLLLTGCGGQSSSSSDTAPVSIQSSDTLPVPYRAQQESEWCWAAAMQMVLAYDNLTYTQAQIVSDMFGSAVNQPATSDQIRNELYKLSNGSINAQVVDGPLTYYQITEKISQNIPLLVQYENGADNHGHMVVIYGYDASGNILINDPFYGQFTIQYGTTLPYWTAGSPPMTWLLAIVE